MSLRVVHTFGRNAGAVQTLDKPVIRFGRAPDNDVVFDPNYDRDASSHHAEAHLEASGWVLVDLQSRNGTLVRGQRVVRHVLAPGEEVTFGAKGPRVRFEFQGLPGADPLGQTARDGVALGAAAAAAGRGSATAMMEPEPGAVAQAQTPAHQPPVPPQPVPAPPPPPAPAPPPPQPARAQPQPQPAPPPNAPPPNAQDVPRRNFVPAQAAPPPMAPAAGARVGQRTIAMMISSAVAAATGRSKPRKTQEIHALVDQRVSAATAGQRRTSYVLGGLIVIALLSLGGLIFWGRQSEDEISKLREDLAKLPPNDPRRKDIEGRLGTLHPSNANFGRNLYDRSKKGIFMLASPRGGFCTAFAVRPNVLATNAHCVVAAKRIGGPIVALENEGRGQVSLNVTDMRPHPGYRDNDANALTPDVGIVTIAGRAAAVLEVANAGELAASGAGDDVYLIGFPGRLMDAQNPAATFMAANIGRITTPAGKPGAFADSWLVQHDAATTAGTSGSPIFNGKGKVIAVNAGGYLEGDDETIAGKKTEVVKASPYKFGMRIDLLDAILK